MTETLDKILIKQMAWKPSTVREVAKKIVTTALEQGKVWPDSIDFSAIGKPDKNCIGSAWRMLGQLGIIELTKNFRKSTAANAKSRMIFCYRLRSKALGETFLKRNEGVVPMEKNQLLMTI